MTNGNAKHSLLCCYMLAHIINYDGHTYETRLEQLVAMQNHSSFCCSMPKHINTHEA